MGPNIDRDSGNSNAVLAFSPLTNHNKPRMPYPLPSLHHSKQHLHRSNRRHAMRRRPRRPTHDYRSRWQTNTNRHLQLPVLTWLHSGMARSLCTCHIIPRLHRAELRRENSRNLGVNVVTSERRCSLFTLSLDVELKISFILSSLVSTFTLLLERLSFQCRPVFATFSMQFFSDQHRTLIAKL